MLNLALKHRFLRYLVLRFSTHKKIAFFSSISSNSTFKEPFNSIWLRKQIKQMVLNLISKGKWLKLSRAQGNYPKICYYPLNYSAYISVESERVFSAASLIYTTNSTRLNDETIDTLFSKSILLNNNWVASFLSNSCYFSVKLMSASCQL